MSDKKDSILEKKWFLMLLDKLFLGLIVSGVILYANYKLDEKRFHQESAAEVSKVYTDILISERKNLTQAYSEFLVLVDDIRKEGELRSGFATQMGELADKVRRISFVVDGIRPNLGQRVRDLFEGMVQVHLSFSNMEDALPALKGRAAELQESYQAALDTFRDVIREVVKEEFKSSHEN